MIEASLKGCDMDEDKGKTKIAKKANHEIGFTLEAGGLDFITRKIYNALIYHAQRDSGSNKGVLPDGEWDISPEDAKIYWWLPLGNLIADASTGKRYDRVFDLLKEMQKILVQRNGLGLTGLGQESAQLLGGVRIVPALHPKKNSGGWIIGWHFPAALERHILQPGAGGYTRISLWYQSLLSAESSLALYELCRQRVTWAENPSTDKYTWQDLQALLVTCKKKKPRETYKEFKRDTLKKAMDEINSKKTDIEIELEEIKSKTGRGIESVRFNISFKKQTELPMEYPSVPNNLPAAVESPVLDALQNVGVAYRAAITLLDEFGEDACLRNLDLYASQPGKKSPGWLVSAIKNDFAGGERKKLVVESEKAAVMAKLTDETNAKAERELKAKQAAAVAISQQAISAYLSRPEAEREAVADTYCQTLGGGPVGVLGKAFRRSLAAGEWAKPPMKLFAAWLGAHG